MRISHQLLYRAAATFFLFYVYKGYYGFAVLELGCILCPTAQVDLHRANDHPGGWDTRNHPPADRADELLQHEVGLPLGRGVSHRTDWRVYREQGWPAVQCLPIRLQLCGVAAVRLH
eukprot:scaffold315433_cov39-Prasinocladus_malaysianus.AAC.1